MTEQNLTSGITTNGHPMQPGVMGGMSAPMGHYAGKHMVEHALDLGWHDEMARGAVETYDEWYHREDWAHADHWHDMLAEAEDWLNEQTEGGYYGWQDGDFVLMETMECPFCSALAFADPAPEQRDCPDHMDMW
jgi:hypothetical protein